MNPHDRKGTLDLSIDQKYGQNKKSYLPLLLYFHSPVELSHCFIEISLFLASYGQTPLCFIHLSLDLNFVLFIK
jgi:hypothetical protein